MVWVFQYGGQNGPSNPILLFDVNAVNPQVPNIDIWFEHDGTLPYYVYYVRDHLGQVFPSIIGGLKQRSNAYQSLLIYPHLSISKINVINYNKNIF